METTPIGQGQDWPKNGLKMENFWAIFAPAPLGLVSHLVFHFFPVSGFWPFSTPYQPSMIPKPERRGHRGQRDTVCTPQENYRPDFLSYFSNYSKETAVLKILCHSPRMKNQPKEEVFRYPADIRGSFARMSRPKTSVRAPKILAKNKHLGADIHDPKARTSTTPRDFQKTLVRKTLGRSFVP